MHTTLGLERLRRSPKPPVRTPGLICFAIVLAMLNPGMSYGKSAKDFFREGERLLKAKDPYGAYKALAEAVKLDTKNKKYRRTFEEAGRLASDGCVLEAISQISSNPSHAMERLRWALDYNPENRRAAEMLAAHEAEIGHAKLQIETERQSLNLDRVGAAEQTLRALRKYKELVPNYALLEVEVSSAQRLLDARTALDAKDLLAASRILASGSIGHQPKGILHATEARLRSDTLAEAGRQYSASRPGTIGRARAAAVLQSVSDRLGPQENADDARAELLSFLNEIGGRDVLQGLPPHGTAYRDHPSSPW